MAASSDLGETPLAGNRFTEVAVRRCAALGHSGHSGPGNETWDPRHKKHLGTKHHGGVWWDAS